tara:strand:+ start:241 stop:366 length:126 start_codon:yes stop_codon:yes gene_type:complete
VEGGDVTELVLKMARQVPLVEGVTAVLELVVHLLHMEIMVV